MLGERVSNFQLGLFRAMQECVMVGSPYRSCYCDWSKSFMRRLETIMMIYGGYNDYGNGTPLLWGMVSINDFLNEDRSFVRGSCVLHSGEQHHSETVPEEKRLAYKVQAMLEEFDVIFCICELKNRGPCNAKHANPWIGPID